MPVPNPYQWRSGEWTDRAQVSAESIRGGGTILTVVINGSGMRYELTRAQALELSEVLALWADDRKAPISGSSDE